MHTTLFQVPRFRIQVSFDRLRSQQGHLAGILLALDEGDDIVARRNKGVSIFEGATDPVAIDGQRTVSEFTFGKKSGDF